MAHPKEILRELQASARKSLSQNFLTSPHWADTLTRVVVDPPADAYWEIGPGLGALTSLLVKKTDRPVTLFEYDRKLAAYLRQNYPDIELVEGDFLKADLKPRLSPDKKIGVLSNLPYHLSSPILFKLIEHKSHFTRLVLTFQKEFADRLVAMPRTEDYSGLSVLAQLHFRISSLGILPAGAFFPAPAVASQAVLLEPREETIEPGSGHVSQVVKASFAHRRKKVISNLKGVFPAAPLEAVFARMGISENARPEELTKEQFLELTAAIKPHICEAICEK